MHPKLISCEHNLRASPQNNVWDFYHYESWKDHFSEIFILNLPNNIKQLLKNNHQNNFDTLEDLFDGNGEDLDNFTQNLKIAIKAQYSFIRLAHGTKTNFLEISMRKA